MRQLCLVVALLLLGPFLNASSTATNEGVTGTASVLTINELGRGTAPLDGKWQFSMGDDMGWAAPAFDDSKWEQISADEPWGAQGHPSQTGMGWYRRHIKITPVAGAGEKFAILMPPVDDAYELYWNGEKIGQLGSLPPTPSYLVTYRHSFAFPISASAPTDGVLAIRVWKAPLSSFDPDSLGGLNKAPLVGSADAIGAIVGERDFGRIVHTQYARALSVIFLLMGALSLIAWARNRGQLIFLWFGVMALMRVAIFNTFSDTIITRVPSPIIYGMLQVLISLADCSVFLLLLYLFDLQDNRRIRRLTWIMVGINFVCFTLDGIVAVPWSYAGLGMQWVDAILTAIVTLSELYVFVLVYQGIRRKLDWARKLVAVVATVDYTWGTTRIWASQGSRFTHWTLGEKMSAPVFHIFGANITVGQLLDTALLLSVGYALLRYFSEQRRLRSAIEMELKSARELQSVLIPEELPEIAGYAIASVYQPAQ